MGAVHCATIQMATVERARRDRTMIARATLRILVHALHTATQATVVVALVAERGRRIERPLDDRRSNWLVYDRLKAKP